MTVPAIAPGLREWWDVCGGVGGGLKIVAIVGVEKPDIGWVIVALPLPLLMSLLVSRSSLVCWKQGDSPSAYYLHDRLRDFIRRRVSVVERGPGQIADVEETHAADGIAGYVVEVCWQIACRLYRVEASIQCSAYNDHLAVSCRIARVAEARYCARVYLCPGERGEREDVDVVVYLGCCWVVAAIDISV